MKQEKTLYKYIYKRTVKKESGIYFYYNVILGRGIKQRYIGCARKLQDCEKILFRYANENNININDFLK
jgi:uncharacterized membrane protein YukC